MKLLFCVLLIICIQNVWFIESKKSFLDTYRSEDCKNEIRCLLKVFEFIYTESDIEFENSQRADHFREMIGENEADATQLFEKKLLVYSILNPSLANSIINAFQSDEVTKLSDVGQYKSVYKSINIKQLERLFAYIGSGVYSRHHEHLFNAKAMCPNESNSFVFDNVSPVNFYICSTLFDPPESKFDQNFDVFVYPIMGVKNLNEALKLETAMIYTLHDVLVNFKPGNLIDANEIHFLAHFAIECAFRFIKNEYKNIRYDHRITPEFPYYQLHSFGLYPEKIAPKKIFYQGYSFYEYDSLSYEMADGEILNDLMPTVRLPVGIIDYDLSNEQAQKDVCTQLDKQMEIIFKFNEPNVLECYNREKENIGKNSKKSFKNYVGELYYSLSACIRRPFEKNVQITDYQIETNNDLLQRVRAKFEFLMLFTLYVDNDKNKFIYTNWDNNNFEKIIPNQKLPTNFYSRCVTHARTSLEIDLEEKKEAYKKMISIENSAELNDEEPSDEENIEEKISEIEIESLLDLSNLSDFDDNGQNEENGGISEGTDKNEDDDYGDGGDEVEDEDVNMETDHDYRHFYEDGTCDPWENTENDKNSNC